MGMSICSANQILLDIPLFWSVPDIVLHILKSCTNVVFPLMWYIQHSTKRLHQKEGVTEPMVNKCIVKSNLITFYFYNRPPFPLWLDAHFFFFLASDSLWSLQSFGRNRIYKSARWFGGNLWQYCTITLWLSGLTFWGNVNTWLD